MINLFQIILKPYNKIPTYLIEHNQEILNCNYNIFNDDDAINFIKNNFDDNILNGFNKGIGKWKADLLRFCLMYKYNGIYIDVDLKIEKNFNEFNIPENVDTVLCIGALTPHRGIDPLPKGELAIGFIWCKSPEPLFLEFINTQNPLVISTGKPYAINIQGLYVFLTKRFGIDYIEPFKIYIDPVTYRNLYFIKEVKIKNKYKIINSLNEIIVHSQEIDHNEFI